MSKKKTRLYPPGAKNNYDEIVWTTSFLSLLKLTQAEKNVKPDIMIAYKRPVTVCTHVTNYKTLAHRDVAAGETGSFGPRGPCVTILVAIEHLC